MIAGVRTGSPQRKNDSSVFSHLTDNSSQFERGDTLKRKDIEIAKPRVVANNLSGSKPSGGGYGSGYGANDIYGGGPSVGQDYDYLQQQI